MKISRGIYQDRKGRKILVEGDAVSSSRVKVVVCRSLYGNFGLLLLPVEDFTGKVKGSKPRFKLYRELQPCV